MKNDIFVLDANTLISVFLLQKESTVVQAYKKAKSTGDLVMSPATYKDLSDAFLRSKFDRYVPLEDRIQILENLKTVVSFKEVTVSINACRDPKDNKYLELAVESKASCIITGDADLLVLHPFGGISILSPLDFLNNF
ncbi:MAG: putative toxin-antitoxin system toxin component, PIN family [Bacteroidota bacterium]|nr:putative toxin-antitoxin system toxin component, PIN family [Bacteroidota bacterium]